ncbi:ETX/MTX2 family pore-forming toxin [Lactococcus garvieae]|uniref:ETX/MTX2 family pore-forming toxin n=1 Tax=Lactococcus garvieae TaxID=1363 RepID=UPI0038534F98
MKKTQKITSVCMVALILGTSFSPMVRADDICKHVSTADQNKIVDVNETMKFVTQNYYNKYMQDKWLRNWVPRTGTYIIRNLDQIIPGDTWSEIDQTSIQTSNLQSSPEYLENVQVSLLDNTSDANQSMSSTSYCKTVTNTTSTQTSQGVKASAEARVLPIPVIMPDGVKLNADVNSSIDTDISKTSTEAVTVPSQLVTVKPHHKVKVMAQFYTNKYSGDITYNAKVNKSSTGLKINAETADPTFSWFIPNRHDTIEQDNYQMYLKDDSNIQSQLIQSGIKFNSDGSFQAPCKTHFDSTSGSYAKISITDVTNPSRPLTLKTQVYKSRQTNK